MAIGGPRVAGGRSKGRPAAGRPPWLHDRNVCPPSRVRVGAWRAAPTGPPARCTRSCEGSDHGSPETCTGPSVPPWLDGEPAELGLTPSRVMLCSGSQGGPWACHPLARPAKDFGDFERP